MSTKLFHITPKYNKDSILSEGLKPYKNLLYNYDEQYVYLARTPYQCVQMCPSIRTSLVRRLMKGYRETQRTYALFGVDAEGLTLYETACTKYGELAHKGTIPPERLTYIGDIDIKLTLRIADAVLDLETLQPI